MPSTKLKSPALLFSLLLCFFSPVIIAAPLLPITHAVDIPKAILVIDLDNDGKASYESFLGGKDGILLFQDEPSLKKEPGDIMHSEYLLTRIFHDYSDIHAHPQNKDPNAIIDIKDPLYHHLRLMFLNKEGGPNEQLVILSLGKANIKEIILDKKYTSLSLAQRQKIHCIVGKAILKDGEIRYIYDAVH